MRVTLQPEENTASALLEGMRARSANAYPAMVRIADLLMQNEATWWRTSGAGTWPEMSASTERVKTAEGLSLQLMVASGVLRSSLTQRDAQGQHLIETASGVVLGTTLFYAPMVGRERPIIAPPDLSQIALVLLRWLIEGRAGSGAE